jgi:hypothetical protein
MSLVSQGVRATVVRLPQVHDRVRQGFVTCLINIARALTFRLPARKRRNGWDGSQPDPASSPISRTCATSQLESYRKLSKRDCTKSGGSVAAHRWRSAFAVIAQEHVHVGSDIPEIRAYRICYLRATERKGFWATPRRKSAVASNSLLPSSIVGEWPARRGPRGEVWCAKDPSAGQSAQCNIIRTLVGWLSK